MNDEEKKIAEGLLKDIKEADAQMKHSAIVTLKLFYEAVQIRIDMEEE